MKRETELIIKGANVEITKVLSKFNDIMNAELETVTSNNITKKATLNDRIELLESEWSNTVELLNGIGIKIE